MAQYVNNDFLSVYQRNNAPKTFSTDTVQYWTCGEYFGNKNNISSVNFNGECTCTEYYFDWKWLTNAQYQRFPKRTNTANIIPLVNENDLISVIQNLHACLTTEISARKVSRLYASVDVDYPNQDINDGDSVDVKFFNDFISALQKLDDYDTARFDVPELSANTLAKTQEINNFITKANELFKDCICYSDCSNYKVCWCYGNCNHY